MTLKSALILSLLVGGTALVTTKPAHACGPDTDCVLADGRTYRIRMPEGHDGKKSIGAIFYAHGYRGTAAGAMRNKSLGKAISDLGIAFVAVKSAGQDWFIANAPSQHPPKDWVETAYYDAVIEDIKKRFNIDTKQLMATGFSAGGMMTWTLACERGEKFAGFAPIAGTFWAPVPEACPTKPAHVFHTHGTSDRVVPLTGRRIGPTKQGDVFKALEMYSKKGRYKTTKKYEALDLQCLRSKNADGKVLELCLHRGGHQFKTAYIVRAWNELKKLGAVE